jgi:hypothetical protein
MGEYCQNGVLHKLWARSVVVVRGNVDTQSCLFGGNVDTQSCLSVGSVFANRACLVFSVGSVIAGPLVVGPSVELLCCSTSGSWDSNIPVGMYLSYLEAEKYINLHIPVLVGMKKLIK